MSYNEYISNSYKSFAEELDLDRNHMPHDREAFVESYNSISDSFKDAVLEYLCDADRYVLDEGDTYYEYLTI